MACERTATVSDYVMKTSTGRRIRKATKVTMGGKTIYFTERMSAREAVRQALRHRHEPSLWQ